MSRFRGKQHKGAGRDARDERYKRAVGRQQLLADRGWYRRLSDIAGVGFLTATPAPAEEFMRPEDRALRSTDARRDFRPYARAARR